MIRKILIGLLVLLLIIQFIRPEKNQSNDQTKHIGTIYPIPEDVKQILSVACYDCHSNNTRYPWYSNFQPVAWWLNNHLADGKRNLNFSTLASRRINQQNHKMEEIIEMIDEGEMPLSSYTLIHGDARLTKEQKDKITNWARATMDIIKNKYPADSLVMPQRPPGTPGG
ncbi:MAG: heme-binding domain-containing protein [Saprospiraceae bacterium]|nr:heme-binding domain-containing protein [Saprospiraceae bacterium]